VRHDRQRYDDRARVSLVPTDGDWFDVRHLPASLHKLLRETGRLYAPLLLANARALEGGQAELQATIDGQPWVQQAFAYQGKCLAWLRRDHQALPAEARERFDAALDGSRCEALFNVAQT
jgi:hypothetical protein